MSVKILDFRAEAAFVLPSHVPPSLLAPGLASSKSQLSRVLRLGDDEAGACKVPMLHHYSSFIVASILVKLYEFRQTAQLVEGWFRMHKALGSILSTV